MDQDARPAEPGVTAGAQRSPEEIEADIAATRAQLGETAAAVAEKADVKAQARARVDAAKLRVKAKREELVGKAPNSAGAVGERARQNPVPLAIAGAAAIGFLLGRRRRSRRR